MISNLSHIASWIIIQNTSRNRFRGKEIKILTGSCKASKPQSNISREPTSIPAPQPAAWASETRKASVQWPKYKSNWIKWDCSANSNHPWCKWHCKKLIEGQNQLRNKPKLSHKVLTKSKFICMRRTLIFSSFWSKIRPNNRSRKTNGIIKSTNPKIRTNIPRRKLRPEDILADLKFQKKKVKMTTKNKNNLISLRNFQKVNSGGLKNKNKRMKNTNKRESSNLSRRIQSSIRRRARTRTPREYHLMMLHWANSNLPLTWMALVTRFKPREAHKHARRKKWYHIHLRCSRQIINFQIMAVSLTISITYMTSR